jgi:hypothetical protein
VGEEGGGEGRRASKPLGLGPNFSYIPWYGHVVVPRWGPLPLATGPKAVVEHDREGVPSAFLCAGAGGPWAVDRRPHSRRAGPATASIYIYPAACASIASQCRRPSAIKGVEPLSTQCSLPARPELQIAQRGRPWCNGAAPGYGVREAVPHKDLSPGLRPLQPPCTWPGNMATPLPVVLPTPHYPGIDHRALRTSPSSSNTVPPTS